MSIYPFLTLLPKIGIRDKKKKKDEWSFFWPYVFSQQLYHIPILL